MAYIHLLLEQNPGRGATVKLNHLRDVVAVAEHGSLRAAGRRIGVAQPAITRSIREVEQELGATLFERSAKGVRLTEIGAAFVRRASAIHSELRRAREEVEQLKGRNVGEISIALSTASSLSLMPSAVTTFRKRFPDAVLKISESFFQAIEPDVLSGAVDFYVGPIDVAAVSQQFAVEKLFDNRRLVLARKGHPLAGARLLSDLTGAEWVRPLLSGSNTDVDFDLLFEGQGHAPPKVALEARSAMVTLLVILNSDLLTILPEQWLDFPLLSSLIAPLPLEEALPSVAICIVRRRDMPLTPLAEMFCDLMRRAAINYVHRRDAELGR
jgi:LysR family transcriptional regulator of abg operon